MTINGPPFNVTLPMGLGMQDRDPPQLAFPATAEITVPQGVLKPGENVIEVRVSNDGWFTWDALDMVGSGE